jgi:hypothetical protein
MPDLNHDLDDPISELNGLEASLLAARLQDQGCPHCRVTFEPIAMSGNGWGAEAFHEPGCPRHDDNLPTPERPGGRLS